MSHYTVGVVLKKDKVNSLGLEAALAEVMAPFDEDLEVEPYVSATLKEVKAKYDAYKQAVADGKSDRYNVNYLTKILEEGHLDTLQSFIAWEYDDDNRDKDENGIAYSTYNPNSKWDWYQIGGRWSGLLDGEDSCLIKDVKLRREASDEELVKLTAFYNAACKEKDDYTEEDKAATKDCFLMYKPEYYKRKFPTLEDYIDSQLSFSTYAVLTADGEWLEPGQMGWFGMSSADPEEEGKFYKVVEQVIKSADPEDTFVVVDCHI